MKIWAATGSFVLVLLIIWTQPPPAVAQTPAAVDLQLYGGLTITGAVGTVYTVEYLSELSPTNDAAAWRCLEFVRLPASPYLWSDRSTPATAKRFYKASSFAGPTNFVFIPPGTFRMGSPTNEAGRSLKEGPQMEVTLSRGFWMGRYLVTQGEYQELTGSNPSFFSPSNGYTQDLSRPIDSLSWFDATDYCARLTQRDLAAARIPAGSAYRLPTEAEWEYACRALTSTRFGYGDDPGYLSLTNYAWYFENSGGMTHPVGQKLPNVWGLYDIQGNLEEWCQDWAGPYPGGVVIDPQGPPAGSLRVLRGGYWEDTASYCRAAARNSHEPDARHYHLGLRLVMTAQP